MKHMLPKRRKLLRLNYLEDAIDHFYATNDGVLLVEDHFGHDVEHAREDRNVHCFRFFFFQGRSAVLQNSNQEKHVR